MGTYIVFGIIVFLLILAIFKVIKAKKQGGGCCGCSKNCGTCNTMDNIEIEKDKKIIE